MNVFMPKCDCYPPDRIVLTRGETKTLSCGCGKLFTLMNEGAEVELDDSDRPWIAGVRFSVVSEAAATS